MERGDINNRPNLSIAFDYDSILFVPLRDARKVKILEWINPKWAVKYYRIVPGAKKVLMDMMWVQYNIVVVYFGPRRLWKWRMYALNINSIPFTSLNCPRDLRDFNETIVQEQTIVQYNTLSEYAMRWAGKKGRLFQNWAQFFQDFVSIRKGV